MSDGVTYIGIAIASGGISFAIGWGMIRGKIQDLERRTKDAEDNIRVQYDRMSQLHETFVSNQHFTDIMNQVRDTQREFRDDLKKILSILTER